MMSRWTSPRRCAISSPSATSRATRRTSGSGECPAFAAEPIGEESPWRRASPGRGHRDPRPPDRSRRRDRAPATAMAWASRRNRRRAAMPGERPFPFHLQRDRPLQERVLGPEDAAHPHASNRPRDAIRPEPPDLSGPLPGGGEEVEHLLGDPPAGPSGARGSRAESVVS